MIVEVLNFDDFYYMTHRKGVRLLSFYLSTLQRGITSGPNLCSTM